MDQLEPNTHSFVLKIWLEETAQEAGHVTWRGHITHVPSGKRLYVEDLDKIILFILPYLETLGVRLGLRWRLRRWLNRNKNNPKD